MNNGDAIIGLGQPRNSSVERLAAALPGTILQLPCETMILLEFLKVL